MKKIITFLVCAGILIMILSSCTRKIYKGSGRAYDTVNIGTTANDGTGDPIRTGYIKLNRNWRKVDAADIDMIRLSGHDSVIVNTTAATTLTLPTSGTLISSAVYDPDSTVVVGTNVHLFEGADTLYNPPPYDMRDDAATLFPTIQSAAGDTSNYQIPDKIGDLFVNTATGKIYVSVTSSRGGWRILNYILPLFFIVTYRRRRRK